MLIRSLTVGNESIALCGGQTRIIWKGEEYCKNFMDVGMWQSLPALL